MNVKHIIMNSDSSKDDFQLFPLLKNKHVQGKLLSYFIIKMFLLF